MATRPRIKREIPDKFVHSSPHMGRRYNAKCIDGKRTSNHKFGGREWMDEFGRETFDWPPLHTLRHKPLQAKIVDNNSDRFFLGANGHMPLLVFIHDPKGEQRSRNKKMERGICARNRKR